MKTSAVIGGMLATMLLLTSTIAQEVSQSLDPPNVTVVEKKWHKEVLSGEKRSSSPLTANDDYQRQARADKAVKPRDEGFARLPAAERMPTPTPPSAKTSTLTTYVYQIKVQNSGAKRITAVDWEYQFLDPNTGQSMGSRRIPTKVKIKPGEARVLQVKLLQQPTGVVNADQLDKKYREQFTERVIIHRLEYADGSIWERPGTP